MIVRMGLSKKLPGLSTAEFRRHWREVHGPLAAKMPGLRAYHQNHIVDKTQLAIDHDRGNWDLDGISELWFDDLASMDRAIASDAYPPTVADSPRLIAATTVIVAEQTVVVPRADSPLIKRISILERRKGMSRDEFRTEWLGKHAAMVADFPLLAGYTQNLVIGRGQAPGIDDDTGEPPLDGIVEMWFRNQQDLCAAFRSPAADTSQAHALHFLETITAFLVEPHVVI
ncbi:EthD family reductase [Tardiphaga sp. vice352]|uniref:EthD domain-containing protein n=1 Tax=unclassified Tardiphaga TaxID=2631404 RepID=UPI0011632CE4|nr:MULTISPECIES: EthD domain-containing protein [unclassified Tardiphaga]QDM17179.1 EthD family reductase [Tardiphaga sp. vice278]QDM27416.1 EthD family reductase [Tardiphaga sp. vice304]QDM32542.1 EthD family reductase [Tardiphaga sp. vice352]